MKNNLDAYVSGSLSASERRVLFTKWVGEAWEEVSAKKEMVIRSFEKVGIALPIDGSEDSRISIRGLEDYSASMSDDEYTDDDSDPFASEEDSSCSSSEVSEDEQ